jgi:hypothetical protein
MRRSLGLLAFVIIVACNACKIEFKIKSGTKRPFQLDVLIPSIGKHTERLQIDQINAFKRTKVRTSQDFDITLNLRSRDQTVALNIG